jgi:azurin
MFDYKKHKSLNEAVLNVINKKQVEEEIMKAEIEYYGDPDPDAKKYNITIKKTGREKANAMGKKEDLKKYLIKHLDNHEYLTRKDAKDIYPKIFGKIKEETDLDEQFNNLKEHFDSLIITLINENKVTSTFNIDLLYTVFAEGYNLALEEEIMKAEIEYYGDPDPDAKKYNITIKKTGREKANAIGKKEDLKKYLIKHLDNHEYLTRADAKDIYPEIFGKK